MPSSTSSSSPTLSTAAPTRPPLWAAGWTQCWECLLGRGLALPQLAARLAGVAPARSLHQSRSWRPTRTGAHRGVRPHRPTGLGHRGLGLVARGLLHIAGWAALVGSGLPHPTAAVAAPPGAAWHPHLAQCAAGPAGPCLGCSSPLCWTVSRAASRSVCFSAAGRLEGCLNAYHACWLWIMLRPARHIPVNVFLGGFHKGKASY